MKRSLVFGSAAIALVASAGMAQDVTIDNGVAGDGHLRIDVDGYGAFTNWGPTSTWPVGANQDHYDPRGVFVEHSPMFAASFRLFAHALDRNLFDDHKVAFAEPFMNIDNTYNLAGGSFDLPTPSGVSVNPAGDTATSAWTSFSFDDPNFYDYDLEFDFELVQTVSASAGSVGILTQVLTITNRSPQAADFWVQRHLDIDYPATMSVLAAQDVVGSVCCDGVIQVYQRPSDANPLSAGTISLTSPDAFDYVAGKSGFDGGGGTPMLFGTDPRQMWDNAGYPDGWRNYTAGVGHAPDTGELPGNQPAGSITPFDAFINIEWADIHLEVDESITITSITNYGSNCTGNIGGCEGGCPCACNFDTTTGINVCDLFDFLAFQGGFVTGETCMCDIDLTTGPGVCDLFDFLAFQGAFVKGCQ